jgi:NADH-quinone oxidoreductase subunit J
VSRRLAPLLALAAAAVVALIAEWLLFTRLGPLRAIFAQVSVFALLAALGVVLARNLVHAGLFLVAFFFLIACQFVLLEVEFLAAMQVLVYIGAVSILLMFGIMLTRDVQDDATIDRRWSARIPAAAIALGLAVLLGFGILAQGGGKERSWPLAAERPPLTGVDGAPTAVGGVVGNMAPTLGAELMTRWVVPFELAGLLLTAALVGAIALARGDESPKSPGPGARVAGSRSATDSPNGSTRPAHTEPVGAPR